MGAAVFVGIDAGGTSTVVRAEADGKVVFEGSSGPGNAISTSSAALEQHLGEASDGCPQADTVAGCFAGMSNDNARRVVTEAVRRRFPGAELRLGPDYLATALAAGSADVVAVAGTGSVCCSFIDGRLAVTGGLGYLLGDRGSAFRYGQALVEHALTHDSALVWGAVRAAFLEQFGTTNRSEVVRLVHTSPAPAELLARFARTLGDCADAGEPWALQLVRDEAARLAATAAHHVETYAPRTNLSASLAGSVWNSTSICAGFVEDLLRRLPGRELTIDVLPDPAVAGAVLLAAMDERVFDRLVQQGRAVRGD